MPKEEEDCKFCQMEERGNTPGTGAEIKSVSILCDAV